MGEVRPIPTLGGVVRDVRRAGRALRVSWHREAGLVVLSLWDGPRCTGTVRVAGTDVPALIEALQVGLPPEPVPLPADEAPEPFGPPPADEAPEPFGPPPADEVPEPLGPPPADEAHGPEDGVAG